MHSFNTTEFSHSNGAKQLTNSAFECNIRKVSFTKRFSNHEKIKDFSFEFMSTVTVVVNLYWTNKTVSKFSEQQKQSINILPGSFETISFPINDEVSNLRIDVIGSKKYFISILFSSGKHTPDNKIVTNIVTQHNLQNKEANESFTVIIPVYNAYDDVKKCIESAIKYWDNTYKILIINDASPDSRIVPMLESYAKSNKCITLINNDQNLGYTKTVNKACKMISTDVVLLNSDTIVTKHWSKHIHEAAYTSVEIGTVTPISNAAGAFSVPKINEVNEIPKGYTIEEFADIIRKTSSRKLAEAPTGNGFCLYIKREVFDKIGYFDEESFPKGYGEENDFCMRALKSGFKNVIDDRVFIFHKRSASFGDSKNENIKNARTQLAKLHPEYSKKVQKFIANHPLKNQGEAITKYIETSSLPTTKHSNKQNLLFVIHKGGGGSVHTNLDLMSHLNDSYNTYLLVADRNSWEIFDGSDQSSLGTFQLDQLWNATFVDSQRKLTFSTILSLYSIDLVHFRSLIGTGSELLNHTKSFDTPIVFSFHDFYTICPSIQLINSEDRYCGGKCNNTTNDCFISPHWFGDISDLKNSYIHEWRNRMSNSLKVCDRFVTTADSAATLLKNYYSRSIQDKISIIEHGRDNDLPSCYSKPQKGNRIKIACIGAFSNKAKGIDFLQELFTLNAKERKPLFEFHIFGNTNREFKETEKINHVFHHGTYNRDNLGEKVLKVTPSFSLIASIWPETYCHTLTESWFMGLPVFATSLGAVKDRIKTHGGGWLLPADSPSTFYDKMKKIATNEIEIIQKRNEISQIALKTKHAMALEYKSIYQNLL